VVIKVQFSINPLHPGEVGNFVDVMGLEGLQHMHPEVFFCFLLFFLCIVYGRHNS
jgi:hypothetical protein